MSKIEFGELRIGPYAEMQLKQVIRSNWASGGPKVKEFEEKFGKLFNAHCAAVSSGTDADINACLYLYELGAERGKSEVIVPALCFIAVANAVRAAGLVPRFVDIDPATLNIDPSKIEAAINENTVAIMAVNTMGKPCDILSINKILNKYRELSFIIDNCEGHGCKYQGTYMEDRAEICTYSFYIAHLVCCGEGGAITSKHKSIIENVLSTRSHGRLPNNLYFNHIRTGLNSKMNDMEASIGLEGIENFERTFNRRHDIMMEINDFLSKYHHIYISKQDEGDTNCPHGISVTFRGKDDKSLHKLQTTLDQAGIHFKRNFGSIPTQHKAFADMGYKLGDFPNAEHVGDYGIHIGCHQYLSNDDVKYIITSLEKGLS